MGIVTHSTASFLRAVAIVAAATTTLMVGCGVVFGVTHRSSSTASVDTANLEFEQLRARFVSEQPLLDMNQRQARVDVRATGSQPQIHTFHTVIFDTRGSQRLIHMNVPYWWVRGFFAVGPGHGELKWLGQLTFLDDTEFDPEPIRLSLKDIVQHGPGLIADYRHPSGGQFISWVD
jgi:hypothetical protein